MLRPSLRRHRMLVLHPRTIDHSEPHDGLEHAVYQLRLSQSHGERVRPPRKGRGCDCEAFLINHSVARVASTCTLRRSRI